MMMYDDLDFDRPVMVFDTSAILDLSRAGGHRDLQQALYRSIRRVGGDDPQCIYHPISLAELAGNTHEEVLQARSFRRPQSQHELRRQVEGHQRTLEALQRSMVGDWRSFLPFRLLPRAPDMASYLQLSRQRSDFRNLRCLKKSGVVAVATMVDHQILSLASSMQERTSAFFVSGDQELLGAAAGLGLGWLSSRDPDRVAPYGWKDCGKNLSCISGCSDGVADCHGMFEISPASR